MKRHTHPITRLLFVAVALLLGANVAVGAAELVVGGQIDGPWVDLIHVNVEANILTGFATSQLALASLLLLSVAAGVRRTASPMSWYWLALGLGFAYLATDEAVRIHERLGPWLIGDPQWGGPFRYAWVVPGMIAVAIAGLAFVPFLQRLPARTRVLFLAAGAIYVGGAIGAEMLGAAATSYFGRGTIAASASVLEEVGELFGVLLLIHAVLAFKAGLARHARSRVVVEPQPDALGPRDPGDTVLAFPISRRRFSLVQGSVIGVLLIASFLAYALGAVAGGENLPDAIRLVTVDGEGDLPAYWSALNLLLAAVLLLVIAESVRLQGGPHLWRWRMLSLGFLTMSVDESVQLHEYSGHFPAPLNEGGWVIYAVPLCAAIAVAVLPLMRSLDRTTRRSFIVAGAMFLGGAVAFEGLGGLMLEYELAARGDFVYDLRRLVEEGLEMVGIAFFNVALLREIGCRRISLTLFDRPAAGGLNARGQGVHVSRGAAALLAEKSPPAPRAQGLAGSGGSESLSHALSSDPT